MISAAVRSVEGLPPGFARIVISLVTGAGEDFLQEKLLIVDDNSTNLRFLKMVLTADGFDVRTASEGGEAVAIIRSFRPRLVLMDVQLPGASGLEITRQLKADPATRSTIVVAVTAYSASGDEQKALDAGCDDYLPKPVDVRALRTMIRKHLAVRKAAPPALDDEMADIRASFISEGLANARRMLQTLGPAFDVPRARTSVHNWKGAGETVGVPGATELGRKLEDLLKAEGGAASPEVRELLTAAESLFLGGSPRAETAGGPAAAALPKALADELSGKRIALLGFDRGDADRLTAVFDGLSAFARTLDCHQAPPGSAAVRPYDLLILSARAETSSTPWMNPEPLAANDKPLLAIGPVETLFEGASRIREFAQDFLLTPWTDSEVAFRAHSVITKRAPQAAAPEPPAASGDARIVLADDDPTIRALLKATLQNYGMHCEVASDGKQALEMILERPPDAAILDVNMPFADGFEVLQAIRNEAAAASVRVILLTARQQETDILRGFHLGADDYLAKPFSPMELVARLKRLLARRR